MLRFTSHHSPCIALVVLLLILGQPRALPKGYVPASQTADEAELRLIATQFFTHYAKEGLNSFMSLWSVDSPERAARQLAAEKFFAAFERVEAQSPDIRRVPVEGNRAKVWVVSEMRAVDALSGTKPNQRPKIYESTEYTFNFKLRGEEKFVTCSLTLDRTGGEIPAIIERLEAEGIRVEHEAREVK